MELLSPINLFLNVSLACNMRCARCYGHLDQWPAAHMPLDVATAATELFLELRDPSGRDPYIMLFGGEPLLNWDMIVAYLAWLEGRVPNPSFDRYLFTNAVALDRSRADLLLRHELVLYISMDGDYETYRRTRPISRVDFDHVVDMIRYCQSKRPGSVIPHLVIKRAEIPDVRANLEFVASLGVEFVTVARDFMESWTLSDRVLLRAALCAAWYELGLGILVYPETTVNCRDCRPTSIMVYPDGSIYDLCYVFGTIAVRRGGLRHEDLAGLYLGRVGGIRELWIDTAAKRATIRPHIDCPTVCADYRFIDYLET